jgi:hypothetical protein
MQRRHTLAITSMLAFAGAPLTALAQDGVIVYRLGRDTVAIEQFSRTPVAA